MMSNLSTISLNVWNADLAARLMSLATNVIIYSILDLFQLIDSFSLLSCFFPTLLILLAARDCGFTMFSAETLYSPINKNILRLF